MRVKFVAAALAGALLSSPAMAQAAPASAPAADAGAVVTRITGAELASVLQEIGWTAEAKEVDGKPFRGALVENLRTGVRTCYEVDGQTTCWTIWNNGGKVPYCCPEPQSWTTNAPNMPDPEAEGFRSIAPGGTWSMKFRLYAK